MTKINSIHDVIKHIRMDDRKPEDLVVVGMAKLTEWLMTAWNNGRALGYKEACDAYRETVVRAQLDEKADEAEAIKVRCAEILRGKNRAKRG